MWKEPPRNKTEGLGGDIFPAIRGFVGMAEVWLIPVLSPKRPRPLPDIAAQLLTAVRARSRREATHAARISDFGLRTIRPVTVFRISPGIAPLGLRVLSEVVGPRQAPERSSHRALRDHQSTACRLFPLGLGGQRDSPARLDPTVSLPPLRQPIAEGQRFRPTHPIDRAIVWTTEASPALRLIGARVDILAELSHRQRIPTDKIVIRKVELVARLFVSGAVVAAHPESPCRDAAEFHPIQRRYTWARIAQDCQNASCPCSAKRHDAMILHCAEKGSDDLVAAGTGHADRPDIRDRLTGEDHRLAGRFRGLRQEPRKD